MEYPICSQSVVLGMVTSRKPTTWLILVCTDMYWLIMMIQLRKPDILWYASMRFRLFLCTGTCSLQTRRYGEFPNLQTWYGEVWRSIGIDWYAAV